MSGWGSVMYCMVIVMTWHAKEEIKQEKVFIYILAGRPEE